jgi:hypothetical protein
MRIADCRMRIEKEYNSEIRNPKSAIQNWMADACGATCLSFRALAGLSQHIRSTNLEMILRYQLDALMRSRE